LGVHSFAISPADGHIFITPSMTQSLLEFNPETKEFTTHDMVTGYYAHTIRADEKNRIWFTLAASSQIGMLDRNKGEFKFYNLPARSLKEWVILKALPLIFSFDPENRPEPTIDTMNTGVPMPYGIDIASDGTVWFARLYGNDIGFINPEDDTVTMIKTPFDGPRRMRVDADNNVWIVAFQDSQLVKYDPKSKQFTHYDMPVANELPYSLNVDREQGVVWVNGNQSDTIFSFDIASEQWMIFPLPRKRTFTRDIEFDTHDGVYTTNSHFPSWQIEDGQPTLIRLRPIAVQ
jgi:virginiamycin B lyase